MSTASDQPQGARGSPEKAILKRVGVLSAAGLAFVVLAMILPWLAFLLGLTIGVWFAFLVTTQERGSALAAPRRLRGLLAIFLAPWNKSAAALRLSRSALPATPSADSLTSRVALFLAFGLLLATAVVGIGALWDAYPWAVVLLGITVLIAWAVVADSLPAKTTDNFGSARYATDSELRAAGLVTAGPEEGLVLARNVKRRVWPLGFLWRLFTRRLPETPLLWHQFFALCTFRKAELTPPIVQLRLTNVQSVAPTGAGKGSAEVAPTLLRENSGLSFVVNDPKGESFGLSSARRSKTGRVFRLDPMGVCGPGADSLNPLDVIDPDSPKCVDRARALADSLVIPSGGAEPHWDESALILILGLILVVVLFAPKDRRDLREVRRLIADESAYDAAVERLRGCDALGGVASVIANHMRGWKDRELSSVKSVAGRNLAFLDSPEVARCVGSSTFDPRELRDGPAALYLVLPPEYLNSLNRLTRMWVSTVLSSLVAGARAEGDLRPVVLLLDEAPSLGPLRALTDAITLYRGYRVFTWLFLQSLGQLEVIFPGNAGDRTALANFDTKIFFGINDCDTADYISRSAGQGTVRVESTTVNTGPGPDGRPQTSGSTSTSETSRSLISPDEVIGMERDRCLIFSKGLAHPAEGRLRPYFEDPELRARVGAMPPPPGRPHDGDSAPHAGGGEIPEVPARPLLFDCPYGEDCGARFRVKRELLGKKVRCPKCRRPFLTPDPAAE